MSTVAQPIYPEGQGPDAPAKSVDTAAAQNAAGPAASAQDAANAANATDAPQPGTRQAADRPPVPSLPYGGTVADAPGANTAGTARSAAQASTGTIAVQSGTGTQAATAAPTASKLSKALSILGTIAGCAPVALQFVATTIVGIQHFAGPGASGDQKKQAVIEMVAPVLGALNVFAPRTGSAIATAAGSIESTVQNVFDLIQMLHPQVMQVSAGNTGTQAQ